MAPPKAPQSQRDVGLPPEPEGMATSANGLSAAELLRRAGLPRKADPNRVVVPFPTPKTLRRTPFQHRPITLLPPSLPRWTGQNPDCIRSLQNNAPFASRPIPLDSVQAIAPHIWSTGPSRVKFHRTPYVRRRPLGEILVADGAMSQAQLDLALSRQKHLGMRLGDLLLRSGLVDDRALTNALGQQFGTGVAAPLGAVDEGLNAWARQMPLALAQRFSALPWRRIGTKTLIATSRPEMIENLGEHLPAHLGPYLFSVVSEADLEARMHQVHGPALARAAECRVPEADSCRVLRARGGATVLALCLVALCLLALAYPVRAIATATLLGIVVLILNIGLRAAAWVALRRGRARSAFASRRRLGSSAARDLPSISIFVPLHDEPAIASALTRRLSRLDYPRVLLDVCLVVEADDWSTRDALAAADLPHWMRVIPVPDGQPRTKPRAMNYALTFARGQIVGIYDAEDAPAPDQLRRVAARFQTASPEVACLQGALDFYNPTRNWMSRCFTIEYANWFRMVLPGLEKMGFLLPLGGTTLFFRRDALEAIGAWDAHNVTEDADLGVRLARRGLRTEMLDTTTLEEANASPLAWVKQRSRWMKGYILTWAVHSRHPIRLWHDLGPKRFWGFHLQFMGAILNAILMPFLWSTLVVAFGFWHPVLLVMPGQNAMVLGGLLITATVLNMALAMAGCAAPHHRHLRRWVATLEAYFPLATLAVAKALIEIVLRPFHWDKTTHGAFGGDDSGAAIDSLHNGLSDLQPTR